jgi:DNA-binding NarL/FixJ family response regulator
MYRSPLVESRALEFPVTDRIRVLLVDDNPAMLEVVERLLQKEFNIVGTLEQASAVVREAPEIKPDVLILDISMGELNGFEITRQLRREKCLTKIIFLTVHEELEFIRAAFDAGASGYVFKSRLNTDLRAAINAVQAGRVFLPRAPIPQ